MSTEITRQDLEETRTRMFFIVGTSRSGSTLLQSMLNAHSKVAIPPETHFFKSLSHLESLAGENPGSEFSRKLIHFWYDHKTRMKDMGLNKSRILELSEEHQLFDATELFNLHLTLYRKNRNKSIAGEKTPRHILYVDEILKTYPQAKIISMFRDPRASAWSEIKAYFGSPSVIVTIRRWRKYVQVHEELKSRLPGNQYLMLQYRDLIESPEDMLREISAFLGIDYEPEMLNFHERKDKGFADGETSWKKGTLQPLQKDRNEEWADQLNEWQVALTERTAGDYLEKMGYDSAAYALPLWKRICYQFIDMGRSVWATLTNARDEGYISPEKFKL